jgi:hypothetical protein
MASVRHVPISYYSCFVQDSLWRYAVVRYASYYWRCIDTIAFSTSERLREWDISLSFFFIIQAKPFLHSAFLTFALAIELNRYNSFGIDSIASIA